MSHALHGNLIHLHHHSKKHFSSFKVKHNVSEVTIFLLIILALQINIFYVLGLMPIQSNSLDIPMSFAGSTLPVFSEIIQNFFLAL